VESTGVSTGTGSLPVAVNETLQGLIRSAQAAFETNLISIILFGSGAEGQLRTTSDVNLLFLLSAFIKEQADRLRDPLRVAKAAIRASAMFLLESELEMASNIFAVKFTDIARRHQVLYGTDPFAQLQVSAEARKHRLRQVLLNLQMRMRERYVMVSLREEQLPLAIADLAGPLRAAAVTLLELEGEQSVSPKQAFEKVAEQLAIPDADSFLHLISEAREKGHLPAGKAMPVFLSLMELAARMADRLERMA
jgi:hypothetical protein